MNLLDLLFPKTCLECGKSGEYICIACLNKVQFASTICPVCKRFTMYGKTHDACFSNTSLNGFISLWEHEGVIRKAIVSLKYKFATEVAKDLAKYASVEVRKFHLPQNGILVAVPLHASRQNWRGFNQAEEIGKLLANGLNWPFIKDALIRKTATPAQVKLHRIKRLRNISGKIAVNVPSEALAKWHKSTVYIVDDVWTTGATLKECGKVLKEAGLKNVWGLTIARA